MQRLSTLLELVGLALLTTGAAVLAAWLGLVVAGAGLILLALALDRPAPAPQQ